MSKIKTLIFAALCSRLPSYIEGRGGIRLINTWASNLLCRYVLRPLANDCWQGTGRCATHADK